MAKLRLAVCVSGGGTTLRNLCDRIDAGTLDASVELVIASSPKAGGAVRERCPGLNVVVVDRRAHDSAGTFSGVVWGHVREAGCGLVCLAGFLSRLTIAEGFEHRVLNIHPALLPAFGGRGMYGRRVHQAVLDHGSKVSGCTVHFADATYDTGPILVQRCVPVLEDDTAATLAARVFAAECEAYPQAIQLIAARRVTVTGRRVSIAGPPPA